ncbi:hypothetical protein WDJ51_15460 [Rathayibacter sp. YIM 133350]|uniref:hypothetical protein n=1 Tax=Rathayibacter sp. YIM 133350 TaxID=3131992 RepID=UPI00307D4FC9
MKRFGRRRRKMQRFDASALPEPEPLSIKDTSEEGILVAEYAARMQLKNRVIVAALTSDHVFADEHFVDDATDVLTRLIDEMVDAAAQVAQERADAAEKPGRGVDMHDYHRADLENLHLRERTYRAVADGLRSRRDDPAQVAAFIRSAREDAWSDIAGEIGARLDLQRPPSALDARYQRTREQRMRLVKNVDLARLALEHLEY